MNNSYEHMNSYLRLILNGLYGVINNKNSNIIIIIFIYQLCTTR
jgi:hypothetical protein